MQGEHPKGSSFMDAICVHGHKNRPLACRCAGMTRVGSLAVSHSNNQKKKTPQRDKYVF